MVGCSGPRGRSDVIEDLVDKITPPSPSQVARDAFNVYDADVRRRSVALLSSSHFGGEEPYVRTYRLLMDDPDPTVRAACIHALGLHGTPEDAPAIIAELKDDTGFVRWEAAKALQKIHHDDAVLPLMDVLGDDEDPDVRIAAAKALGQYPTRAVFNALIGALSDPDFGVVQSASESLSTLTGQDLGTDGSDWLAFADKHPADLFAQQREYTYMPYQKPPGKLDKLKFWDKPEPVTPKTPVGLTVGKAGDAGA